MRTTLVLLALVIGCGEAEPTHQNNPPPPVAQMTARLRYDYQVGLGCGRYTIALCAQTLTLAASYKTSLIATYAGCELADGSFFDIDCRGHCIHQQVFNLCANAVVDVIQCPAPTGTPQGGASCGWHFP